MIHNKSDAFKKQVRKSFATSRVITLENAEPASQILFRKFRKPKKVFKTAVNQQPHFVDQVKLNNQMKQWLSKAHERKNCVSVKSEDDQELQGIQSNKTLNLSPIKLYKLYNVFRRDEKIVNNRIETQRKYITSQKKVQSLKINLRHIAKIRNNSQPPKVILSQRTFKSQLQLYKNNSEGFRPGSIVHHQKKQSLLRSNSSYTPTFKYQPKKYYIPISQCSHIFQTNSKKQLKLCETVRNYSSKSKPHKIWETLGMHDWTYL